MMYFHWAWIYFTFIDTQFCEKGHNMFLFTYSNSLFYSNMNRKDRAHTENTSKGHSKGFQNIPTLL